MKRNHVFILKKSILFINLFLLLFCSTATKATSYWDGYSYSTKWYDPNKSVYYLQSAADLCGLSHLLQKGSYVDFTGKEVILMTDIDLGNYEWKTLGCIEGSYYYTFKGTFNGNGNRITGMKLSSIHNGFTNTTGLFGVLMEETAVIKNLIVEGEIDVSCVSLQMAYLGGITGLNYAHIYNCISKVDIKANGVDGSNIYAGSLVGDNYGRIRHCQSQGNITISQDSKSKCRVGGVAGNCPTDGSEIGACKSKTNITVIDGMNASIGGITAISAGRISDNLYSGTIESNDCYMAYAGGIVNTGKAENCLMLGSFGGYGRYYYTGAITPITTQEDVINCYYSEKTPNDSGVGFAVDSYTLTSGDPLPNFNTSIWNFSKGEYPDLYFEFEEAIEMPVIERIELDKNTLTMNIGDAEKLNVSIYPPEAESSLTWTSSDENIVSISSEGWIVAKKEGTAYVTVETTNNLSATCRVEVVNELTANEDIQINDVKIEGSRGKIHITTTVPIEISIYTMSGKFVRKQYLVADVNEISVTKGIYIVKTKNKTQKVMVR